MKTFMRGLLNSVLCFYFVKIPLFILLLNDFFFKFDCLVSSDYFVII